MVAASTIDVSRPLRILYAEDHPELRQIITEILSRAGHHVTAVGDGLTAFQRFAEDPTGFDLVITDHHMPNVTGLELVSYLRAAEYPGRITVLSSVTDATTLADFRALHVDSIVAKPATLTALREMLGAVAPLRSLPSSIEAKAGS